MAFLSMVRVAKQYGGHAVLKDISLELASGEFLALLGPSGCGKTTLLRILAGFEQADLGCVRLGGIDITSFPANRRNMGMVFQAYSLFPNMSAADNVRFGLRKRKLGAAEQQRRVDEMLELVGLADHANKYPHQLSGGQQQRIALARALAIRPNLLLLDEPLSALDAKVRVQLRAEIRRIQRETGITTLFVTHDQEEALSTADRVAVMYGGELVQVGPPAEIYQEPAHSFVAQFIGVSCMLSGRIVDGDRGVIAIHGMHVHADHARGLDTNAMVNVYLRPEHVRLGILNGSGLPPDTLAGTVRESVFLGATTRLTIDLDTGEQVLSDIPTAGAAKLSLGCRVHAGWDGNRARVLVDR